MAVITAETTQVRRKSGVLTVRMRLVNDFSSEQSFYVVNNRNYDACHVVAKNKKYLVLRDSEKARLAPPGDAGGGVRERIKPGAGWTWWARYPAPPKDVTSVSYHTPLTAPSSTCRSATRPEGPVARRWLVAGVVVGSVFFAEDGRRPWAQEPDSAVPPGWQRSSTLNSRFSMSRVPRAASRVLWPSSERK